MEKKIFFLAGWLFSFVICCQRLPREHVDMNQELQDTFAKKRRQMVEEQIIARGIQDSLVLKAMMKVERHLYVPEVYQAYAYNDEPLPIAYEQTISQPYIVA
ncbi:hypothetical protein MUP95_08680, partial [bacterium]|nr:hypothetical protein [bacterium]